MNRQLNILFLGGAKRVSMARMFVNAALAEGLESRLFSYELDNRVPIREIAEIIIGKRWNDPSVVDHLVKTVSERQIDIVVPFVDGAVAIASRLGAVVPRLFVPTSDEALSEEMFDKVKSDRLFHRLGLPTPDVVNPSSRVIAKPRFGSASKGLIVADSIGELPQDLNFDDYLIQRYVENRQEITVDCYIGRNGVPLVVSPRLRIEVVGGEVSRTKTIVSPEVVDMTVSLINSCKMRGAVTVQFIRDFDNPHETPMIMEVNPRLGGGAVCTVHAGGDIPSLIIRESLGKRVDELAVKPDVEIARYMQEVVV